MGMGFPPTWLRQVIEPPPPASQNHFNDCAQTLAELIRGTDQTLMINNHEPWIHVRRSLIAGWQNWRGSYSKTFSWRSTASEWSRPTYCRPDSRRPDILLYGGRRCYNPRI